MLCMVRGGLFVYRFRNFSGKNKGESLGDIRLPGIVVTPETVADFIAQQDKEYEALAPYKP